MIKEKIQKIVSKALQRVQGNTLIEVEIFVPENDNFGHYSTNVAMRLAKIQKKNPLQIAEEIKLQLLTSSSVFFDKVEVVAPGFINLWIKPEIFRAELKEVLKKKENYGKLTLQQAQGKKVQLEFISANPTGALTMGNGRGGFWGDTMANILKFSGRKVTKEYYVNDAKNSTQIKELGKTGLGLGTTYLTPDVKKKISKLKVRINKLKASALRQAQGIKNNLEGEVGNLIAFEIHKENKNFIGKKLKIKFDKWFSEQSLYNSKAVDKLLADLKKKNLVYEKEGALWFKATQFGDSEDRVLVRSTGEPTYFLPDLAYHFNKFKVRKFDEVIDVWGADHHGYIPRLKAGLRAAGVDETKLKVVITQLVRLIKGGQEYKMSKRKGEFVTMADLINEIGLDAARFFFLMSAPDTHMNFDLDLAKERSMKNPVYYAQYALVRCQSILRKSKVKSPKLKANFSLLNTESDIRLMLKLSQFPEIIEAASKNYNPQLLVRFVLDLAKEFNNFYEKERIIGEEKNIALARLELVKSVNIVLKTAFKILGISAPKKM